jgi:hypothetical protein
MKKLIRLDFERSDADNYIKISSDDRYILMDYDTIVDEPFESIEEIKTYFTDDIFFVFDDDPDDIKSLAGGRFSKKGLKQLHDEIYAIHNELSNEVPHRVTDAISDVDPNL